MKLNLSGVISVSTSLCVIALIVTFIAAFTHNVTLITISDVVVVYRGHGSILAFIFACVHLVGVWAFVYMTSLTRAHVAANAVYSITLMLTTIIHVDVAWNAHNAVAIIAVVTGSLGSLVLDTRLITVQAFILVFITVFTSVFIFSDNVWAEYVFVFAVLVERLVKNQVIQSQNNELF